MGWARAPRVRLGGWVRSWGGREVFALACHRRARAAARLQLAWDSSISCPSRCSLSSVPRSPLHTSLETDVSGVGSSRVEGGRGAPAATRRRAAGLPTATTAPRGPGRT